MAESGKDIRNDDARNELSVPSTAILQLITAHLTETGLHRTAATLQQEGGVGLAASLVSITQLQHWVKQGQWDVLLRSLSLLDSTRNKRVAACITAITSQAILELAEDGEWETAYSLLRTQQTLSNAQDHEAASLNSKLADLAARRDKDRECSVPEEYYACKGLTEPTRLSRRDALALQVATDIPKQPEQRLPLLLQQAVQWHSHTGQIPAVKRHFEESQDEATANKAMKFDLVVGEVDQTTHAHSNRRHQKRLKTITQQYAAIKFGKHASCTSACFWQNSLITGSSDGLVEVWDITTGQLRTDLPYQTDDAVLSHEGIKTMAVSNDGTLLVTAGSGDHACIWKLDNGKLLRRFAITTTVTAVAWSPTTTHVLLGCQDGTVREFGLRSGQQLKVFASSSVNQSTSYVTSVSYYTTSSGVSVATTGGDGAMRLWNGATAECFRTLVPSSTGKRLSAIGSKLGSTLDSSTPELHTLLPLPLSGNWILVPRGLRAFKVDSHGLVLQVYDSPAAAMTGASVSPHHLYVTTEKEECHVYDLDTGTSLRTLATRGSTIMYRPFQDVLAVYNNDSNQKKGKLYLWK